MAAGDATQGELLDTQEKIRNKIEKTRNGLYHNSPPIIFSHLLKPLLAHTSHLIYAPFDAMQALGNVFCKVAKEARTHHRPKELDKTALLALLKKAVSNISNWLFLLILAGGVYLMAGHGEEVTCLMQNVFLGWAIVNRSLSVPVRFLSISGMMMLRMVVANVLPFTSPAFAFLIAKSMPEDQLWAGSFFLLFCSMPAGALVPCLDWLAYKTYCLCHRGGDEPEVSYHFLATACLSHITDFLPFCFWVRPWFMEPAFAAAVYSGATDAGAAAAAVLAGHFMIWAGPATTMHQRRFAPDWPTCIIIQPIGLLEDVAVTLATWAGETNESQKQAEMALYIFMLTMNVVYYYTKHGGAQGLETVVEHCTVGFLTLVALSWRIITPAAEAPVFTTTTTTKVPPLCKKTTSNVQAIMFTVVRVSILAFLFQFFGFLARWVVLRLQARAPKLETPLLGDSAGADAEQAAGASAGGPDAGGAGAAGARSPARADASAREGGAKSDE